MRCAKARQHVHVSVGVIPLDASRDPATGRGQCRGLPVARASSASLVHSGIAPCAQQTTRRGEQGATPVSINRTPFKYPVGAVASPGELKTPAASECRGYLRCPAPRHTLPPQPSKEKSSELTQTGRPAQPAGRNRAPRCRWSEQRPAGHGIDLRAAPAQLLLYVAAMFIVITNNQHRFMAADCPNELQGIPALFLQETVAPVGCERAARSGAPRTGVRTRESIVGQALSGYATMHPRWLRMRRGLNRLECLLAGCLVDHGVQGKIVFKEYRETIIFPARDGWISNSRNLGDRVAELRADL